MEVNLLIGGEAGQGAFSVELELTEALSRLGYHFFATKNYMSRIRGGHNFHTVRVSEKAVHAPSGRPWDLIVALDDETRERHLSGLRPGGVYLPPERVAQLSALARESFGGVTAANTILVGVILAALGVGPAHVPKAAPASKEALVKKGHELAGEWGMTGALPVAARAGAHRKFDGNQALALGAILGGCQFMAGYPMTPATSIMHYFAEAATQLPIHFEQAEDEIAAVNMALGASYAGLRSMVATSGGGFALMQEGISLAGMTETPLVVALAQRPGPATGLPTRTEQGDLSFVLHAGHGPFPRLIFAPGSLEELIGLTRKAFCMADRFQLPCFVLTDQYLADSVQIMEGELELEPDSRQYEVFGPEYRRFRFTSDGVSPLTFPGLGEALVKLDSDEHDEEGKITEDRQTRIKMVEKRLKKAAGLKGEEVMPSFAGDEEAGCVAVCWGSTKHVVQEAVALLNEEGIAIASLHFSQVYPLTRDMIAPYELGKKRIIAVENNATASFARVLEGELGIAAHEAILKYDGEPFNVEELRIKLKAVTK